MELEFIEPSYVIVSVITVTGLMITLANLFYGYYHARCQLEWNYLFTMEDWTDDHLVQVATSLNLSINEAKLLVVICCGDDWDRHAVVRAYHESIPHGVMLLGYLRLVEINLLTSTGIDTTRVRLSTYRKLFKLLGENQPCRSTITSH